MLAVLTTHPIQYQVPIWRALAARGRVPFEVLYLSDHGLAPSYDPGFGQAHAWDIGLTDGYAHHFIDCIRGPRQDSFWWLRLGPALTRRLQASGARILWTQGWQVAAYWQAVWQAKALGLDTWLRAETNLKSSGTGWRRLAKDPLLTALLQRIDRFLAIGKANRQFYLARGIPPARIVEAPYCVDNARFRAQAARLRAERDQLRAAWGIPRDAFCLLFVGKLIGKKRPLDLIDAARALGAHAGSRPLHLLVVGTGDLLPEVRARCSIVHDGSSGAASRPTQGQVRASLTGFLNQSEIARAYVAADCLVLPSEATETWGLVVNEAMACGLPAVVSEACGCCDDLVKPYRPDLCFPPGDTERLARAIQAVVAQPPSSADVASLIERYDVIRTAEAVEQLYAATIAARRGAAA